MIDSKLMFWILGGSLQ